MAAPLTLWGDDVFALLPDALSVHPKEDGASQRERKVVY